MTCLEKYITACDAADAQLSADLAACNGNPSCEKAAVDRHTDAITAAKAAYDVCVGSGTPGGGA